MTEPLDARSEREIIRILEKYRLFQQPVSSEYALRELFVRVREQAAQIALSLDPDMCFEASGQEVADAIRKMELKGE